MNIAIFGAAFGDEGKACIVHRLAKSYNMIVRFSSGSNAGHTIYHQNQKIVRHLIPSADFSIPRQLAFLGSGMVIDPRELYLEILETLKTFPCVLNLNTSPISQY